MSNIPLAPTKFAARRVTINVVDDYINPTIVVPPLYLQINPSTFQMNYAKKINRTQTFAAYVEEYWGEDLDSITANNSTGGFISESDGITTINRTVTTPYFKFQDVLDVYRNNGNIYDNKGRVVKRGGVIIFNHPGVYLGFFENFDYTEDATSPYRFTFNFNFRVEKSYTSV